MKFTAHTLIKRILVMTVAATLAAGCQCSGNHESNTAIVRYEQLLFDTPHDGLAEALVQFDNQFNSPLLNVAPGDENFMNMLYDFVNDSTMRSIYNTTENKYPDLQWLEKELAAAMSKAHKANPEIEPYKVATFVSGYFDYNNRLLCDRTSRTLVISLDQYALQSFSQYSYFGLPMYLVELSDSIYIATDIMAEIASQYIATPAESNMTMLDMMIAKGKMLYFLDIVMPNKDDRLKIRYSEEQMEWMQDNEKNVWAYFIQHQLLFEKDFNRFHNFVDEAPKTNAFKDSAPRTTEYIGWQIVRNYMNNNKVSMQELFADTDSQSILAASKYKP